MAPTKEEALLALQARGVDVPTLSTTPSRDDAILALQARGVDLDFDGGGGGGWGDDTPQSTKDSITSGILTTANSTLFGFGEEMGAAGAAGIDELWEVFGLKPEADYNDRRLAYQTRAREAMGEFAEENPKTALGLEIAGGLALPGVGVAKTGVLKSPSVLRSAAKGAGIGAAGGAVAGAGYADGDLEDRAVGAAQGAGMGAVFGAGVGGLTGSIQKAGRSKTANKLRQAFKARATEEIGAIGDRAKPEKLSKAQAYVLNIFDDATDDELLQAAQRIEKANKEGVPLTLFEALDTPQGYAEAKAISQSRGGRGVAGRFMEDRRSNTVRRLEGVLDEIDPERDYYQGSAVFKQGAEDMVADVKKARKGFSKPLYEMAAEEAPIIDSTKIDDALEHGIVKDIIRDKRKNFPKRLDGLPDNHYQVLHEVKRGLDDKIGKLYRDGAGNEAQDFIQIRNTVRDEIDNFTPKYQSARRMYQGFSEKIDYLEGGQWGDRKTVGLLEDVLGTNSEKAGLAANRLLKKHPSQLSKIAREFESAGKLDDLRKGVRAAFQEKLETASTGVLEDKGGSIVDRLFKQNNTKEKLVSLLGEDEALNLWSKLELEGLISRGETQVGVNLKSFGSPTEPMKKVMGEQTSKIGKLLSPVKSLKESFENLKPSEQEELTKEIAEELFSTPDPEKFNGLMQLQMQYNDWVRGVDRTAEAAKTLGAASTGRATGQGVNESGSVRPGALSAVGAGTAGYMSMPDDKPAGALPKKKVGGKMTDVKAVEAEIDQDPIDAAIYETESGRNPKAKNPKSTASGGFQLIKQTAKNLGVDDPFDLRQNYEGYRKLRKENEDRLGISDPEAIYAAHFLGAPLMEKYMFGKKLTKAEEGIIKELEEKALPRFKRIYEKYTEA